jgi:hypothetical protein
VENEREKEKVRFVFDSLSEQKKIFDFIELKNREYYMTHDVRPPFTYATLIRQVNKMKRIIYHFFLLCCELFRRLLNLQIVN